jgi:iron complex transport system substrate-binding protein
MGDVAVGRIAAAAAAFVLLAAGCGERGEPLATATVVQVRATVLDAQPRTVGGVGRMAALVAALGGPPAGRNPDLVAAWSSEQDAGVAERAGSHGFVAPDDSLEEVAASIADLALLLGDPARARPLIERIQRARRDVERRVHGLPRVKVFVDLGFFSTAGERTLVGDMIDEAGGVNVAGATPEPGPFDLRQLAAEDPAVYVISSDSRTTLDFLRANPRTQKLRAVADDRVVLVPAETLAPGPRVGEGLEAIARALHPDVFR